MAVSEVRLHSQGASGGVDGKDLSSAGAAYRSKYLVKVSSAADGVPEVLRYFRTNSAYPWIGRAFRFADGFDTTVSCRSVNAEYVEKSDGWYVVECRFETVEVGKGGKEQFEFYKPNGKGTPDPTQAADDIEVSFTQYSVPVEFGTFRGFTNARPSAESRLYMRPGRFMAISNSAGVPYDPTPEAEIDVKIIRISRNVPQYYDDLYNRYQGTVNSDNVVISKPSYNFRTQFGPYFGRIKNIGAVYDRQNGIAYYRQTVEIHVNPYGWRRAILDRGTDRRTREGDPDGTGGRISASDIKAGMPYHKKITDLDGNPTVEPMLLDGNGQPLDPSLDAVYGVWSVYEETPFMPLRGRAW